MKSMKTLLAVAVMLVATMGSALARTWTSGGCTVTLENGVMTVSKSSDGNGIMADYDDDSNRPWDGSKYQVLSIVVSEGVTKIGSRAFSYMEKATSVTLPASVTVIGDRAFLNWGVQAKSRVINYTGTVEQWCSIEFNSASNTNY